MTNFSFSQQLLDWFDLHGRKQLPWQQNPTPYRVWISEIMLQQTQVATVIDYYQRFMARFPDLKSLASAPVDDALHLWSGLGYYSRARNLHATAQQIEQQHLGNFPSELEQMMELPGIGRSTAGAIRSIAFELATPILDGNVKRVLTRYAAIEGWPGKSAVSKQLWQLAEELTPPHRSADYTQAIMDLGATLCTRSKPSCDRCPMQSHCQAHQNGQIDRFPTKKPKVNKPNKAAYFLMFVDPDNQLLLTKRPASGIWGGLWSFPELSSLESLDEFAQKSFGLLIKKQTQLPTIRHTFSHFSLDIKPLLITVNHDRKSISESQDYGWYLPEKMGKIGLPAPVNKLISAVAKADHPNLMDDLLNGR